MRNRSGGVFDRFTSVVYLKGWCECLTW
jgi:hypothetical protein